MTAEADPSTTDHRARSDGSTATPIVVAVTIFVIAFALRFLAARLFAGEPVWDGHYYDFGARRIAEGHGYSDDRLVGGRLEWHPWCHYPVGYSAYLAFFYWLLGSHGWVAHVANGLTGALVCVIVYLLAREGLSERRARLAGALTTLHPGLILYGALVMGELLSALTVMGAFWLAIRGSRLAALRADANGEGAREAAPSRRPVVATLLSMRGVAAGALVLGAGALVRPQALLC
ncbi:MAG: glycosyltransferase family 39 protein, partial [Labilithrix sp.]|nr:glycosyltransferase family 39 protein [Labilithrix sp.]